MLSGANYEIRRQAWASEQRRRLLATAQLAISNLDRLVGELEELNLAGITELPPDVAAQLGAVGTVLPAGINAPGCWPTRTREALDCCFDLLGAVFHRRYKGEAPS